MSSKGYGFWVCACACAVITGLCIAGPGLMRVRADSKVDTANLMIRLNDGDIVDEYHLFLDTARYCPKTATYTFTGPGKLNVQFHKDMMPGNRFTAWLREGESATFTPSPEVRK